VIRRNLLGNCNLNKRDSTGNFLIKVRRLSPRLIDCLTHNEGGFATDDYETSPNNHTIQHRDDHWAKGGLVSTRYQGFSKNQRMHYTDYKNAFPRSSKKSYNSVETAIVKEVNELNKKHFVPLRKCSLGGG
jgi:hypothetical protein